MAAALKDERAPVRTIAIINQKGGCGKTTVAINLASVLAASGQKTLLVDMDPQSHCALGLAVPEAQVQGSISDVLHRGLDGSMGIADIVWQISRYLDLAPSTLALAGIEQALSTAPDKDRRLAQVLAPASPKYEYCIIDCPPSIGLLTFNALRAAAEVIIPVETSYFALQGAKKQEATIQMLARRAGHRIRVWVLATMYDVRTKLAREVLAELRKHFGASLLPVVVNYSSKLKEAASFGQAIGEYDPASRGYQDFEQLSKWLQANPLPAPPEAQGLSQPANPALSRAAELVERARALSARAAALSARLERDPDTSEHVGFYETHPAAAAAQGAAQPVSLPAMAAAGVAAAEPIVVPQLPATPASDVIEGLQRQMQKTFGVRRTSQGVLFVQPLSGVNRMAVAGDFNGWSPSELPMHRDEDLGVWQVLLPLPPGKYHYRLVADDRWMQDPYNSAMEVNAHGEFNNIVEVQP